MFSHGTQPASRPSEQPLESAPVAARPPRRRRSPPLNEREVLAACMAAGGVATAMDGPAAGAGRTGSSGPHSSATAATAGPASDINAVVAAVPDVQNPALPQTNVPQWRVNYARKETMNTAGDQIVKQCSRMWVKAQAQSAALYENTEGQVSFCGHGPGFGFNWGRKHLEAAGLYVMKKGRQYQYELYHVLLPVDLNSPLRPPEGVFTWERVHFYYVYYAYGDLRENGSQDNYSMLFTDPIYSALAEGWQKLSSDEQEELTKKSALLEQDENGASALLVDTLGTKVYGKCTFTSL